MRGFVKPLWITQECRTIRLLRRFPRHFSSQPDLIGWLFVCGSIQSRIAGPILPFYPRHSALYVPSHKSEERSFLITNLLCFHAR